MLAATNLIVVKRIRSSAFATCSYGGNMPLNLADINTDYIIQKICGSETERHHLEALGFIEGETVRIVSILFGSYIVRVKDSKIGVNQDFAKMIIVQA